MTDTTHLIEKYNSFLKSFYEELTIEVNNSYAINNLFFKEIFFIKHLYMNVFRGYEFCQIDDIYDMVVKFSSFHLLKIIIESEPYIPLSYKDTSVENLAYYATIMMGSLETFVSESGLLSGNERLKKMLKDYSKVICDDAVIYTTKLKRIDNLQMDI